MGIFNRECWREAGGGYHVGLLNVTVNFKCSLHFFMETPAMGCTVPLLHSCAHLAGSVLGHWWRTEMMMSSGRTMRYPSLAMPTLATQQFYSEEFTLQQVQSIEDV